MMDFSSLGNCSLRAADIFWVQNDAGGWIGGRLTNKGRKWISIR